LHIIEEKKRMTMHVRVFCVVEYKFLGVKTPLVGGGEAISNSFRDILLPKMLEKYTDSGKVNLSHLLDGKVEKGIEIKRRDRCFNQE
jgi:hypothetical protein